jgi:hypothetical protein
MQYSPYLILGNADLGVRTNAIGSSWCDEQGSVVYVQGKDTELVAFQLSSAQNNPTWSTAPGYRGSNPEYPASISFASVCILDGQGIVPVFVNRFEPDMETGWMDFATMQTVSICAVALGFQ